MLGHDFLLPLLEEVVVLRTERSIMCGISGLEWTRTRWLPRWLWLRIRAASPHTCTGRASWCPLPLPRMLWEWNNLCCDSIWKQEMLWKYVFSLYQRFCFNVKEFIVRGFILGSHVIFVCSFIFFSSFIFFINNTRTLLAGSCLQVFLLLVINLTYFYDSTKSGNVYGYVHILPMSAHPSLWTDTYFSLEL